MLFQVFRFLEPDDLARAMCVASVWNTTGRSEGLWKHRCEALLADKVYVPDKCNELLQEGKAFEAYRFGVVDAKREHMSVSELTSFTWYRRMKRTAGEHWTDNDPYWQGATPHQSHYHEDGTTTLTMTPGYEHPMLSPDQDEPPILNWRWVGGSCGRTGPQGSFIRQSMNGRDFPTMVVQRHKQNWGWIMNNCWAVATSFPPPPPGADPELEDENLPVNVTTQRDEAMCFNLGLPSLPEYGQGEYSNMVELLLRSINQMEDANSSDEEGNLPEEETDSDDDSRHGGVDRIPASTNDELHDDQRPAVAADGDAIGVDGVDVDVDDDDLRDGAIHEGMSSGEGVAATTASAPAPLATTTRTCAEPHHHPGVGHDEDDHVCRDKERDEAGPSTDPAAATAWLEDFDSRWNSIKERFNRVMVRNLVDFASGIEPSDAAEEAQHPTIPEDQEPAETESRAPE